MPAELTTVDLFCGAGGLTAGLEAAGWRTLAAVDRDPQAMATLRATQAARLPVPDRAGQTYLEGTRLIEADLASLSGRELMAGSRHRSPTLLSGGPPCQPFSSAGKMLSIADARGQLFLEFVRLADELKPRFILFENVRGLLTARDADGRPGGVLELVQEAFEELGYATRFATLNAADYGAPQRRVRLFMFASRGRPLPEFPSSTHQRPRSVLGDRKLWVTLGEFLEGRPQPEPRDVVRPTGPKAEELMSLQPGTGLRTGGVVEYQRPSGHWGYRQDCFLADPTVPARTIRTATSPDWIRPPDGSIRRLTWQECAGLQGFPLDWRFEGTRAGIFRQVGNAVQGDIARALGAAIAEVALESRRAHPRSAPWPPEFQRRIDYTAMEERVNGPSRRERRIVI